MQRQQPLPCTHAQENQCWWHRVCTELYLCTERPIWAKWGKRFEKNRLLLMHWTSGSQFWGPAKLVSQAFLLTLLLGFFYYRYVSSLNRSLILCDSFNQHSCKDKICFWPVCEFSVCLLQFCRTECFRTHFLSNDPFVMSSHLSRNIVGSVFVQALRPSLFFCAFPRS